MSEGFQAADAVSVTLVVLNAVSAVVLSGVVMSCTRQSQPCLAGGMISWPVVAVPPLPTVNSVSIVPFAWVIAEDEPNPDAMIGEVVDT